MFNLSDTKVKKKFRGIFVISITILIVLVFYFYYFRSNFIRNLFSYSRDYYNYFVYHPHSGKESVNLEYKLDTFTANLIVIWLMTVLLTITLYFDVLRKILENSGVFFKIFKFRFFRK